MPHVIFLVDFVFVTRDGWALSAATECVLPIITEKIVQRPANAMNKIPKCMSCMTFFIFACLHFYYNFFILYYFLIKDVILGRAIALVSLVGPRIIAIDRVPS